MLDKLSDASKDSLSFRKALEKRYSDLGSLEQIRGLLMDVLNMLYTEFYIRPQFKDEEHPDIEAAED